MARLKGTGWFSSPNTIFDLPLSTNEKIILLCLCRRANADGESFPSVKRIAADCSMGERTVRYALGRLRDAGYLTTESRQTASGASASNLYEVEIRHDVPGGAGDAGGRVHVVHPHYIEGLPIKKESPLVPKGERDILFERFCSVYPKRAGGDGRAKAREIFDRHLKAGVDPEQIIEGARRYAGVMASGDQVGTRFVKQKTAWLNQRCWEDEYAVESEEEIPFEGGIEEQRRRALAWKERNPNYADPDFA